MKLKHYLSTATLLFTAIWSYAGTKDSIVSHRSLFVIPNASYQQETSVAPGVAFGYYFKSRSLNKISSISGSATYTFRHQFLFNLTPKIYSNKGNWFLYSNINLKNYPDYYFGTGNKPRTTRQAFTSQSISLLLQPQLIISKHFYIGPTFSVRSEKLISEFTKAKIDSIFGQPGSSGWEPFSQLNTGILAAYDTRNNQFYPTRGIFTKFLYSVSKAGWASKYSLQEMSIDIRQYIPMFQSHTIAYQAYVGGVFGKSNTPFQLLPTIGGRDLMRGFRQGMYRQNIIFAIQSEYRLPIYKRLKGVVFGAIGDVMNGEDCKIDRLKMTYGAGLRYRINDARVHLRLDFAKNNYGDKLQFYITATEAF